MTASGANHPANRRPPSRPKRPGLPRRRALGLALGALAAPFLRPSRARAARRYKFGSDWPTEFPATKRFQAAFGALSEKTGGALGIEVYPNSVLGGDTEMLAELRSGALEFYAAPTGALSTFVPASGIVNVGFAFKDYSEVWPALDGSLGAYVQEQVEKTGLIVVGPAIDNGFRQLTTHNRPVQRVEDVAGLKIRVPVSPLHVSLWRALGAAPGSMNFNEVYSALESGVYDAEENALPIVAFARLYEVQNYCIRTSHMYEAYLLLANRDAWQRLSPAERDLVVEAARTATLPEREDIAALSVSLEGDLTAKGMRFLTPDRESFRRRLREAGFYRYWRDKFGAAAWSLLEEHVGPLS